MADKPANKLSPSLFTPRHPSTCAAASFALLVGVHASACMQDAEELERMRFGDLWQEEIDVPLYNRHFVITGADARKCSAPTCGGWFVKWLDEEQTACADGVWRESCHMYELDLSGLGLKLDAELALAEDIAAGRALARGYLAQVDRKQLGFVDTLIVSEVLAQTQADIGPAGGQLEVSEGPIAGLVIEVPPGAVDELTHFSVQARDRLELGELESVVGPAAELEPHGVEFLAPVTVTMPVSGALLPDSPVLMLKEGEYGRRVVLPEDPDEQLEGRIRVRVGEFSRFQPFQRDIDEMVEQAEAMATCEHLSDLQNFAVPWAEHVYYYEGSSLSATIGGVETVVGADNAYDLYHSQLGSFWYLGQGLYTSVLGVGAAAYAGWAIGERDSVLDAWTGNVVSAAADIDVVSAFTGFLSLGVGVAVSVSCADFSHLPGIPDNRICYPEEIQSPWVDAVAGAAGSFGIGINVFPEFGGLVNVGVTDGWWNSWGLNTWLMEGLLSFAGVPHEAIEVPAEWPAVGDTANYIQVLSPDGTQLGRGKEMARAILMTTAVPDTRRQAAELAILQGLARDEGLSLGQYCAPPGSRCIAGQLHYTSSNDCISGPASGVAELYRSVEGGEDILEGELEIGEDGSFCADMSPGHHYYVQQNDQDGSGCWPGYLVHCRVELAPGVGNSGGVCSLDTCEDLGELEFDCGS